MSYYMTLIDSYFTVPARYAQEVTRELTDYCYEGDDDEAGNIAAIGFNGENPGDTFEMFQRIAPMVDDGCYLEFSGEDGSLWRWVFKNGKCHEINAMITWPEVPKESEEN